MVVHVAAVVSDLDLTDLQFPKSFLNVDINLFA